MSIHEQLVSDLKMFISFKTKKKIQENKDIETEKSKTQRQTDRNDREDGKKKRIREIERLTYRGHKDIHIDTEKSKTEKKRQKDETIDRETIREKDKNIEKTVIQKDREINKERPRDRKREINRVKKIETQRDRDGEMKH
jgi:hypothetical protein